MTPSHTIRGAPAIGARSTVVTCLVASAVAGVLVARASAAQAPDAVAMRVRAGLGGIVKAERWVPVRVTITTPRPFTGHLQLAWSDVRLTRAVTFGSPGTRTLELYVRSTEPGATLSLTLQRGDTTVARADETVQVRPPSEPIGVCVRTPELLDVPAAAHCGAWLEPADLPMSPRGYEVADAVAATDRIEPRLTRDQTTALREWRTLRRLNASGALGLTPQPARPTLPAGLPRGIRTIVVAGLLAYVASLFVAGWSARLRAGRAWHVYGSLALIVAAGCGGVLALGRSRAAGIHVRHHSVLQQIPRSQRSLISTRGLAEFGGGGAYQIHADVPDGSLEGVGAADRADQTLDESGNPVLQGFSALASRRAFVMEAVGDVQPIEVREEQHRASIVNRSNWPLRDCRFGDGFDSVDGPFALAPGESRTAAKAGEGLGPLATCVLEDVTPLTLRSDDRHLRTTGTTLIAVYRAESVPSTAASAGVTEETFR